MGGLPPIKTVFLSTDNLGVKMVQAAKSSWEPSEALDKGYMVKALSDLRDKLIRAKAREVPGTEMARLRLSEVEYVVGLINRVGG